MRKLRHRGVSKVDWIFTFACAAYNLVRLRNLAIAVRGCKFAPKGVPSSMELDQKVTETPSITPFDITYDEKQKEKHRAQSIFQQPA
jgi:hypothetical protein